MGWAYPVFFSDSCRPLSITWNMPGVGTILIHGELDRSSNMAMNNGIKQPNLPMDHQ
jgi:hypothetical protein